MKKESNMSKEEVKGDLPESLKSLRWIVGTWICDGEGSGEYPTIQPFKYGEKLSFSCVGKPMLVYSSSSWAASDKRPMHQESGFLRIKPGTEKVSLFLAHNFGLSTVEDGTISGTTLKLSTGFIGRSHGSDDGAVQQYVREFSLEGEDLKQTLWMATKNTELTKHLEATYKKAD